MPALSFHKRFAGMVESGEKRQTIRKRRKHPIKLGDRLYFYTRMRTKECRELRPPAYCWETFSVRRLRRDFWVRGENPMPYVDIVRLAKRDGFRDLDAFEDWFDAYCEPDEVLDVIRW